MCGRQLGGRQRPNQSRDRQEAVKQSESAGETACITKCENLCEPRRFSVVGHAAFRCSSLIC